LSSAIISYRIFINSSTNSLGVKKGIKVVDGASPFFLKKAKVKCMFYSDP